jgi:ATP-dependent Lon protease
MRRNKKPKNYAKIIKNYNNEEITYFNKLLPETQNNIIKLETDLNDVSNSLVPYRFKFLLSNTSNENKRVIINKINELNKLCQDSSEYSKLYKLVNSISKIPLGLYHNININSKMISNYLTNIKTELDNKIYGHQETKNQIIRILAQFIANPNAKGYVIGIQGSMGVGKTKLIKDGIASVLKYPFAFIPLGGISDASYLKGHLYTYEGSTYGKIVDEIIKAKVMNPIFFFDELDKISSSRYGEEITNTLIHLTDSTQNDNFTDKYLEELNLDLSKSLMFFTFNNIDNISPILRDRMIIIKIDKYSINDKIQLSKQFLIKDICNSYNISPTNIIISDSDIEYIITKTTEEDGVRNLQRNINNIYSYINMNRFIKIDDKLIEFPFIINRNFIDKYIIMKRDNNLINLSIYL